MSAAVWPKSSSRCREDPTASAAIVAIEVNVLLACVWA